MPRYAIALLCIIGVAGGAYIGWKLGAPLLRTACALIGQLAGIIIALLIVNIVDTVYIWRKDRDDNTSGS